MRAEPERYWRTLRANGEAVGGEREAPHGGKWVSKDIATGACFVLLSLEGVDAVTAVVVVVVAGVVVVVVVVVIVVVVVVGGGGGGGGGGVEVVVVVVVVEAAVVVVVVVAVVVSDYLGWSDSPPRYLCMHHQPTAAVSFPALLKRLQAACASTASACN